MTDDSLPVLRDALARVDRTIVDALAERMRLSARVAEAKAATQGAPFDRSRENQHLQALERIAEEQGLDARVVRDVYASLFAASRNVQSAQKVRALAPCSVGVVGGTAGMGRFVAEQLTVAGFKVAVVGLETEETPEALAARVDLLVLAVPIALTAEMAARVGPHVRAGACLADVTSLKSEPLAAMLAATREEVEVVGTHPMFGPSSGSFDRQKVVLCEGRGTAWKERLAALFAALGAEVVHATAAEHDRHMAIIQVLVHEKTMVMGSVLERLGADLRRSLDFASPIYRAELSMIGRMFSQSADLYAGIVTQNPEGARVLAAFRAESERLSRLAEDGDREAIAERFAHVARYLREFAEWARRQSDAILADLVRHG